MPLTPEQIQAARSQYGIKTDPTILDTSNTAQKNQEMTGDKLTSFLTDGKVKTGTEAPASKDNAFTRGYKAIKEAIPSLTDSFSKRSKDIVDYTQKTADEMNQANAQITTQDIKDFYSGTGNPTKINPVSQQLLAPVKNALNFVGQTGGAVGDLLGEGLKVAYKTATPEDIQSALANGVSSLIKTPLGQAGLKKIGEGMESYNAWKSINPEGAKAVENVVNVAALLGGKSAEETAKTLTKEAVEKVSPAIKEVVSKGEKVVTDTFNVAQDEIKAANAARQANNAQKETQKINTLAGTIVQGTPDDIAKAKAALTAIETKGIKTYKDLTTALDDKIASVSSGLDNVLDTNKTVKSLEDLSVTKKVGESEVAHNYVKDAIAQLKTMYEKTNDVVAAEKMAQFEAKAASEGLTVKEINDLAKLHGREINAFNANGEAASGLTKQAAENTRKGLKTTARDIFGNKVYEEADSQLANLMRTKDLVENVAKKVNQLQQRVTERGWGEQAGRLVFQLADRITGGGLKGFVQSFVPRGEGLKIMNALDLEKNLKGNLKDLQKALDGKTEKDVIENLQNIIQKEFPRDASLKGDDAKIQEASISKYVKNPRGLLKQFLADNGKVVNTDEARKLFKDVGYAGYNSAAVQEASSAIAKDAWRSLLKKSKGTEALIYAGGSGTGKTSAVKNLLSKEVASAGAILDGNLSTQKSALARISEALKAGKTPHIVYVYRNPVDAWVNGVIKRMRSNVSEGGRIVPMSVFLQNHQGSYDVVKGLLKNGKIKVSLVDNSLGAGKHAMLTPSKFSKISYTTSIKKKMLDETKKLLDNGSITKQQYEALIK